MSRELTDRFRRQHRELLRSLDDAYRLRFDTPEGRAKLLEFEPLLLTHLRSEDSSLYTELARAAQSDHNLAWLLGSLKDDLDGIAQAAHHFFRKLEGEAGKVLCPLELACELGRLSGWLKGRIQREETILFPEFERVSFGTRRVLRSSHARRRSRA
jgi:Hemerythrin HHE cation binding domain